MQKLKRVFWIAIAAILLMAVAGPARAQSGCAQIAGHTCFWVEISTLSPTAPAQAQVGIAYSQNFTATNASSFSILSGAATQNGLTANIGSSFSITGTPVNGSPASWLIGWSANGGNFQTTVTVPVATLATSNPITVTPATANVNQTQTQQFKAAANFSNQTSVDVTNSANWSLPSGAGCSGSAVGSTGNFSAGSTPGPCTIQAAFGGQDGTATATVLSASGSITIQATSSSLLCNAQQYVAYGLDTLPSGCLEALTATGGVSPYTWTITSGNCPMGMTFVSGSSSPWSGRCSGVSSTPAAGTSITFKVTDSASNSQTVTIASGITVEAISTVAVNAQTPLTANAFGNISDLGTWADGSTNSVGLGVGTQGYASASAAASSPSSSLQVATTTATTTGDFAVATLASYSTSSTCPAYTGSVTSPNETFHPATVAIGESSLPPPPFYNCVQMFYAYNITGAAADQPTCNWSIAAGSLCLVRYYHGMPATDPLDQHPAPTQALAANSCTPNPVTTSQANELIDLLCVPNNATTITPPAGFTGSAVGSGPLMVLSDTVVNSVQTGYAPQATFVPSAQNEVTALATFKANAVAAGTITFSSSNTACVVVNPSTGGEQAQPVTTACTATITGTYNGASPTIVPSTVTVNPSITDTQILVKPSIDSLPINGTVTYIAVGNVTGQTYPASWGSSNPTLASVGPTSGVATCLAATGSSAVSISATVSGFTVETPGKLSCGQSTVTANSCSEADMFAALNGMVSLSGAVTLAIPSGTCTWSSATAPVVHVGQQSNGGTGVGTGTNPNVFLPNVTSLTIQAATGVSCSGTAGTNNYSCTPTDGTTIEDGISASSPSMLTVIAGGNATNLRVTGITFEPASSSTPSKSQGLVDFVGQTAASLRIDHVHEVIQGGQAGFEIDGPLTGVADHDVLDLGNNTSYSNGIRVFNDLLDSVGWGDGGFMSPTGFGSANFFFLESSQISGGYANDCDNAGRMVERYNTFVSPQDTMQSHGTKDYGGAWRGCRAMEFYKNYINGDSGFAVIGGQGGTWLVWGNTVNSANNTAAWFWAGATYRSCPTCNGAPTTNCNGISGANCEPPNGWALAGSDMNYPSTPGSGSSWDGNSSTTTGYPPLDGLGRGQQLYGMNGANFPSRAIATGFPGVGTQAWPNQYLEPIYLFMNSLPASIGPGGQEVLNQDFTTSINRDIYADSASFTGSSGTGFGTLANRPSNCTAGPGGTYGQSPTGSYGVAYFATDANGGQGELFVCTSTNTWTAVYSPYTYPHPLATN